MRPANIVTAWADILAGFAVTNLVYIWFGGDNERLSFFNGTDLALLILCTTGLYGGGVVFNDVFDYELDKVERPERPIPSGRASYQGAVLLGVVLFLMGFISAFFVNFLSGVLSIVIAIAALVYNKFSKHNPFVGPLNMGLCRGLNLLLGMSAAFEAIILNWYLALIPIIFISAITMISRFEVSGGNKQMLLLGGFFFLIVIGFIFSLGLFTDADMLQSIPFLAIFSFMVFNPLSKALKDPTPINIRASVKGGILALIPMDAAIAGGHAGFVYGLIILILLPLSIFLARKFAVT